MSYFLNYDRFSFLVGYAGDVGDVGDVGDE